MEDKKLLTLTEALQKLSVSRSTMYRLIKSGAIKPIRYTDRGFYRFDPQDLDRFISQRKTA